MQDIVIYLHSYHFCSNVVTDAFRLECADIFLVSRVAFSGMLRRVALVTTDVSEELSASIMRVTRIAELGTTLTDSCHPDNGGTTFLRNVGSYKSHTA
jgi:hypothetical protein